MMDATNKPRSKVSTQLIEEAENVQKIGERTSTSIPTFWTKASVSYCVPSESMLVDEDQSVALALHSHQILFSSTLVARLQMKPLAPQTLLVESRCHVRALS